jgi:hypothetical protein
VRRALVLFNGGQGGHQTSRRCSAACVCGYSRS